ncbi:hypothetical protein ACPA54_24140 [Uniformispora flossi]|uniref:hypothetical protein n=1 Tax=Uniformispora flossi TaxID=3390723 RepID=UPI003C2F0477
MSSSARSARTARLVPLAAALAFAVACSDSPGDRPCTLVAAVPGIGIDLDAATAARTESVQTHACWGGTCQDVTAKLFPSTGVGATSCTGEVCAAQATPLPGKHGNATLPGIVPGPVDLTLTLLDASGTEVGTRRITVTAKASYPNGPNCGADAAQAAVLVTDSGIIAK